MRPTGSVRRLRVSAGYRHRGTCQRRLARSGLPQRNDWEAPRPSVSSTRTRSAISISRNVATTVWPDCGLHVETERSPPGGENLLPLPGGSVRRRRERQLLPTRRSIEFPDLTSPVRSPGSKPSFWIGDLPRSVMRLPKTLGLGLPCDASQYHGMKTSTSCGAARCKRRCDSPARTACCCR